MSVQASQSKQTKVVGVKKPQFETAKFEKDINTFFKWAVTNSYTISDKRDDEKLEWTTNLLMGFKEPGRNKLDSYIKKLMEEHTIIDDENNEICDAKLLVKMYKDTNAVIKQKKEVKIFQQDDTDVYKVDNTINTSNLVECVIGELNFSTEILTNIFGKPKKSGLKGDEWRYEWKIKDDDNNIFSIHDFAYTDDTFDQLKNATWFVSSKCNNFNELVEFITDKNSSQIQNLINTYEESNEEKKSENSKAKIIKKVTKGKKSEPIIESDTEELEQKIIDLLDSDQEDN